MPTPGVRRTWAVLAAVVLAVAAGGCEPPAASVAWAPDGRHGIYTVRPAHPEPDGPDHDPAAVAVADAYVLDGAGRVTARLGPVNGSFGLLGLTDVAWSPDSAVAYLVTLDRAAATGEPRFDADFDPDHLSPDGDRQPTPPPPTTGRHATFPGSVLCRWDGVGLSPLVRLPGRFVVSVRPSPDGRWVAMLALTAGDRGELLAYDVGGRRLCRVRWSAGAAVCFTGPHRLAYVAAAADGRAAGEVVEVDLDAPPADGPSGPPLVDVMPGGTRGLFPVGDGTDGLLVQAEPRAYPSPSPHESTGDALYRWDRQTGRLTRVAEHLSGVVPALPSPDGRRLLCVTGSGDGEPGRVVVMDADGTHGRPLLPAGALPPSLPLLPAWHGDRWITVARPASPADAPRQTFDVVDLAVDPGGAVAPVVTLSGGWEAAMRPWHVPRANPVIASPPPS